MKQFLNSFRTRSFRAGSMSLVMIGFVLVLAVLLNVAVALLPGEYTKIDTTADQLYALSDEAKELIASYETDIEILYLVQDGYEDTIIVELLDRASAANPHITVTKIDPAVHPELVSDYSTLSQNSLVVRSAQREKTVDYNALFEEKYYYQGAEIDASTYQSYYMYYQYGMSTELPTSETSYAGESALASAIDYVCTDELPVIYTVTGHDEMTLSATLSGYLADDNVTVKDLQLATSDTVPEDAAAVLVMVPQADLSEDECTRLSDYVKAGGHVVVYTYYENLGLSNLEGLLADFGMEPVSGIVMETDANMYNQYPYYLYPSIEESDYTAVIASKYVFAPYAHGITLTEQAPDGVSVSGLLATSNGSYAKVVSTDTEATVEQSEDDPAGPFYVGADALYTGEDGTVGNLTWYSTPYLAIPDYDSNGAVSDLFLATVESHCEIEQSVSLATKPITSEYLTVRATDVVFWGFVLIALIPVGTVVFGLAIWNKRRKR